MANRGDPPKKEKKHFPFLELPRELRDNVSTRLRFEDLVLIQFNQVYQHAIDIRAGGFASIFRLNRQTHEEAENVLLRTNCFILVKFAWPHTLDTMDFIDAVSNISHNGNVLVLNSKGDNKVTAFKYYKMSLDISHLEVSQDQSACYLMLSSKNLFGFTLQVGTWRTYNPVCWNGGHGVQARELQYHLTINPKTRMPCTITESVLLEAFTANWWNFPHFQITGGQAAADMRDALRSVTKDRWATYEHYLDTIADMYQEGLRKLDAHDLLGATNQMTRLNEVIEISHQTEQMRRFILQERLVMKRARAFYLAASRMSLAAITVEKRWGEREGKCSPEEFEACVERSLRSLCYAQVVLKKMDTTFARLRIINHMLEALLLVLTGRKQAAQGALILAKRLDDAGNLVNNFALFLIDIATGSFRVEDTEREWRKAHATITA